MHDDNGFSLIELLIALTIITVLTAFAYPSYKQHIIKTRRVDSQIALLNLGTHMEHYFIDNHSSYAGATLSQLGIKEMSAHSFYKLVIAQASATDYLLQAVPLGAQQSDTLCGTLTLNQLGEKSQTGTGTMRDCW